MASISAIIIATNAQDVITDCLRSLSFCDEILLIDGGITDNTGKIAKQAGAKIIRGARHNFAMQRNIGLKAASGDWVLYIDTDERIDQNLRENIKKIILSGINPAYSAYRINRKNFYLGNHEWPYKEKLERIFYKKNLKGWKGKLHESPIFEGELGSIDGFILHYTHRDLSTMIMKTLDWSQIEAELRFDSHHPKMTWWRFPRVMLSAFYNSYFTQKGWKAGTIGLIESIYQSYSMFITYARLWEMQQNSKQS